MPVIAMFYGIIITMNFKEHMPPHFHARYGEHEGSFTLDGEPINGDIPKRQKKFIAAWAEAHDEDLKADWDLCEAQLTPMRIEGIRF